jgi:hypothetical protein
MTRTRIDDLGAVGLNTDLAPSTLPPNVWTTLIDIRATDGSIRSVAGETKLFNTTVRPLYHTTFVQSPSGAQFIIVSDGESVIAHTVEGTATDITPTEGSLSNGVVSFTDLNGILVVNSTTDGPFYWDSNATPPGNILKPLPGWDSGWTCSDMRAYRYNLVALGMLEGGVEYPHKVRWSSSAAEGELPTEWVAAVSNDAGADLIGETSGAIVGGAIVRDSLYIIKEDSIYAMNHIGGQYVMQLSRLKGSSVGTKIKKGFAEMRGGLAVFTQADLLLFDGNQNVSLTKGRVNAALVNSVSPSHWELSEVFVHTDSGALVLAGVQPGYDLLSMALVYDWNDNTWSQRRLNNSYGFDQAFVSSSANIPTWDELVGPAVSGGLTPYFAPGVSWDQQDDGSWNTGVRNPSVREIIVYESNPEDTLWWVSVLTNSSVNSDGSPKSGIAERTGIPIEGADGIFMVREIWPELRGSGKITMTVGSQMAVDDSPMWGQPWEVTPGVTENLPVRLSGRFLCLRVECDSPEHWKLGSITVDWEGAGER